MSQRKKGGVPTTPRFHEDDHVVLKASVTGTNRLMKSGYMHHLPAGTKGIINSSKDGVSEVEFRVAGEHGFEDIIVMRVPEVKLDHDPG